MSNPITKEMIVSSLLASDPQAYISEQERGRYVIDGYFNLDEVAVALSANQQIPKETPTPVAEIESVLLEEFSLWDFEGSEWLKFQAPRIALEIENRLRLIGCL